MARGNPIAAGETFERLTVIEDRGQLKVTCRCACGVDADFRRGDLRSGKSRSCGCLMREQLAARRRAVAKTLAVGARFGRFVVLADTHSKHVRVRCDCGQERDVPRADLRLGKSRSCGCLKNEEIGTRRRKHGQSTSRPYRTWSSMIQRCTNPQNDHFADYGGRGITVCDRWRNSFEAFRDDMGPKPSPAHSLDRIDNDGNYEPGNVRWATDSDQQKNQRRTRFIDHAGERLCLKDWADRSGVPYFVLHGRLRSGWTFERAISTPADVSEPSH